VIPEGSVLPDYRGYCLSSVPGTIMKAFGVPTSRPSLPADALGGVDLSGVDNIVLFLIDGLGFNEWSAQAGSGFFGALQSAGSVRPVTTIFPSTTGAALTTLSTGLTVQEHGLLEWSVYLKQLDSVILTLPFSRVGDKGRDTLKGEVSPSALFSGSTIYRALGESGVKSTSFSNRVLAHSVYSEVSHRGSEMVPYYLASDLAASLRSRVDAAKGKNLFYVYWSSVDYIEHKFGPGSAESEVEATLISTALKQGFLSRLGREAAKRTLVILTADHGHIAVDPAQTIYINRFRSFVKGLKARRAGGPVPPWGSGRDMYLLVKKGELDAMLDLLQKRLGDAACVLKTSEALGRGLFGLNKPSRRFLDRLGNLMVLPNGSNMVWYRYFAGDELDVRGHHGGLSGQEMTIPLAAGLASELQRA
jgi:Type I phosphodiesterase / nucleotide pyrophosphatase